MAKKLFIFAIGGSGERVLRSLTMLLAAGTSTFDDYDIYPIILDYDKDNADKLRTVELLQNYADAHNAAFQQHSIANDSQGNKEQFFAAKLCNLNGLNNYLFPFQPAKANEKFREHIGYDELAGKNLNTKRLLESLYDASDRPDTELNLNMDVGFKGNPNIGSVVFHSINETKEFNNFKGRFQPGNEDKVVIIGSLFGGTGASGIPEIVKAIDSSTKNAAPIATVLLLPYFHPMENGERGDAIKASRFNSKTKAALNFYNDSALMDKIDKVYYVGDPYPTAIPYCDGGQGQKNNANIVELIAAMMVEHYVAGRGGNDKEFKFSLNANIVVKDGAKSNPRLFTDDFDNISKNNVLNHLAKLAIGLKLYHDEIKTNKAKDKDFYKLLDMDSALKKTDGLNSTSNKLRDLCMALEDFHEKYQDWLRELDYEGDGGNQPANAHRLALYDMNKKYSDIILKEAIATNDSKTDVLGKFKDFFGNKKTLLNDDFLLTRMNDHLKDNGNGDGHFDIATNAVREGHEPEWVFADILHHTAEDGLTMLQG